MNDQCPLSDEQLDALDTFALQCLAPRQRESVREYGRAVALAAAEAERKRAEKAEALATLLARRLSDICEADRAPLAIPEDRAALAERAKRIVDEFGRASARTGMVNPSDLNIARALDFGASLIAAIDSLAASPPPPQPVQPSKPRAELLAMAEKCGAVLTGKPDGSESITVVFSIAAWRAFDALLLAAPKEPT